MRWTRRTGTVETTSFPALAYQGCWRCHWQTRMDDTSPQSLMVNKWNQNILCLWNHLGAATSIRGMVRLSFLMFPLVSNNSRLNIHQREQNFFLFFTCALGVSQITSFCANYLILWALRCIKCKNWVRNDGHSTSSTNTTLVTKHDQM